MKQPKARLRAAAFTITELIVALLLLCILALLAGGVVGGVQRWMKQAQCLNSLQQSGHGLRLFMSDHNNTLETFHSGSKATRLWALELTKNNYIGNRIATRCPDPDAHSDYDWDASTWFWGSYGLILDTRYSNPSDPNATTTIYTLKAANVPEPTRYPLLADSIKTGAGTQFFRIRGDKEQITFRHQEKANIYFFDGHIESLTQPDAEQLLDIPESFFPPTP